MNKLCCCLNQRQTMATFDGRWIFLLAFSISVSIDSSLCEPRVLHSYTEIVTSLQNGAPIQANVNIKACANGLPKDLPAYSFTEKLDYAFFSNQRLTYNRVTAANGTRLKLKGPVTRIYQMDITPTGTVGFLIADIDPATGSAITAGAIVCRIGVLGFTPIAQSGPGTPITNFSDIVNSLQGGYRVFTTVDLSNCTEKTVLDPPPAQQLPFGTNIFTEVTNYRFSSIGSAIAFSRQIPILGEKNHLRYGYGDIKTKSDGSTDIYYYEYSTGSPDQPVRQHWLCQLGTSIHYFRQ